LRVTVRSPDEGDRTTLFDIGPFRDDSAVSIVGEEPFPICRRLLHSVGEDHDEDICPAIKDIFGISSQSYTMHRDPLLSIF